MVRFKVRWVCARLATASDGAAAQLTAGAIAQAVREGVEENFGDIGAGQFARKFKVDSYDPASRIFIASCNRDYEQRLLVTLFFLTAVAGHPVAVRVLHVSATIKAVRQALARQLQERLRLAAKEDPVVARSWFELKNEQHSKLLAAVN